VVAAQLSPPPACDCWRLAYPFEGGPLPAHRPPCEEAMRRSVAAWAPDAWPRLPAVPPGSLLAELFPETFAAPPGPSLAARFFGEELSRADDEAGARWRELLDQVAVRRAVASQWPLPLGGRLLACAIREWVHGEPSETLARQLAADPRWRGHVAFARVRLGPWLAADPNRYLAAREGAGRGVRPDTEPLLAERLRADGLPATPATLRHLLAVALVGAGRCPRLALPAHGYLVTTLVYVQPAGGGWQIDPDVWSVTSGSLQYARTTLQGRIAEVVRKHRTWAERQAQHPLADIRAVRRAQAGAFALHPEGDESYYDYVAVALESDRVERLKETLRLALHGKMTLATDEERSRRRDERIAAYLNAVQRMVNKRRKRARLPVAAPPGWRARARLRLLPLLT
jgi:hypothetical protein